MSADKPVAPASDYDEFVNWQARLEREAPLFRRLFDEAGVRSVIDVGAGSARHSVMFAEWGLAVDAVDPDDSMLARAEENVAEHAEKIAEAGGELRLVRAGFTELMAHGLGEADALVCTGNALPHVGGHEGLRRTLADFAAVLSSGGVIVLHLLNHARLLEKKPRAIPPVVRDTPEGTKVFLRVIDYPAGDEYLDFDFITLVRTPENEWVTTHRRSPHTSLPASLLQRELEAAGFESVQLLGGHDGHPLTDADESLIVVARKR
ncbi:MAG TPA: class I SAM-dependent methyltransferase [Coriobacteriia bacterium]|nr:class I SAM-dependent methyltransferase [Coriobacteriia bacterium]